jgi:hypothetical protein
MRLISLSTALLLLLSAPRAQAWNNTGHMTVAKLAWEQLDANQRKTAFAILTQLPFYDKFMSERPRPEQVSEMEWVFLNAATWPDWLRDFALKPKGHRPDPDIYKHHVGPRHFINLPVIAKEDQNFFASQIATLAGKSKDDCVKGLNNAMKDLQSQDTTPPQKAEALAWLLHLAGDVHQPLHCAAFFSRNNYPKGDEGGNLWWVKDGSHPTPLHTYWDDLPGFIKGGGQGPWTAAESAKFFALVTANQERLSRAEFARATYGKQLERKAAQQWAEEGVTLAEEKAYAFGEKRIDGLPIRDEDVKGLTRQEREALQGKAPPLPVGYTDAAQRLANRQLALAGHRLTDQLNAVFVSPKTNP